MSRLQKWDLTPVTPDADDDAMEAWHLQGKNDPRTWEARRRRFEVRTRIVGLGRALRRWLEEEDEKRKKAEAREEQEEREAQQGV